LAFSPAIVDVAFVFVVVALYLGVGATGQRLGLFGVVDEVAERRRVVAVGVDGLQQKTCSDAIRRWKTNSVQ